MMRPSSDQNRLDDREIFRTTAQKEQLAAVMKWLSSHIQALDIKKQNQLVLRMQLVLEELFMNSLLHGYATNHTNSIIEIELKQEFIEGGNLGHVWIIYTDYAPAFDLGAELSKLNHQADPKKLGGKGLYLIRDLPDELEYRHLNPGNHIRLKFSLGGKG